MFYITECLFTGRVNKIVFVSNFKTKRSFPRAPPSTQNRAKKSTIFHVFPNYNKRVCSYNVLIIELLLTL